MAHCLGQANQFALVSCQAAMARWERTTEKGNGTVCLVKHRTNPGA
jgi:hypothetical protein